jgi:hypothetical protein
MKESDKKNTHSHLMKYLAVLHGPDNNVLGTLDCEINNGSAEVSARIEFPKVTWVDIAKQWVTPVLLFALLFK